GLREKSLLVEIIDWKERGCALAGRRRQDRWIGQHKATLIKEIADRSYDLGPDAQDGALPRAAHPQVAVLHQKVNAVLLTGNRKWIVFRHALDYADIGDIHFVTTGSALVGPNFARNDHAGFIGEVLDRIKYLGRNLVLRDHTLN